MILLISSAIIYGSVLISVSIYSQTLVGTGQGWDSRYGVFGTAIREVGTIPIVIAAFLVIAGVIFIVKSNKG